MYVECPKGGRHVWGIEINIDAVKMFSHQTMGDVHGYCTKCAQMIGGTNVLALANAAMQLTAEEASMAAQLVLYDTLAAPEEERLRAYAAAWREA